MISKRDLRTFTDQAIEQDSLLRILEAGRRSGSARNRQPWQFVAVTDAGVRQLLARCGFFAGHLASAAAAVVILVEDNKQLFDAGRCAQSMMLAAWSMGIASCPVTLHHDAETRAALGLPEGLVVATAIALGYPDPRGRGRIERLSLRVIAGRSRKPLADLVHWNRYGQRLL